MSKLGIDRALPGDLPHRGELGEEGKEPRVEVREEQRSDCKAGAKRGEGGHLEVQICV